MDCSQSVQRILDMKCPFMLAINLVHIEYSVQFEVCTVYQECFQYYIVINTEFVLGNNCTDCI